MTLSVDAGRSVGLAADVEPSGPEVASAAGWPCVLYFHHVHPTLRHYTSLDQARFADALDVVADSFSIEDPHTVFSEPDALVPSAVRRPRAVLTFDDGYLDVYDHAVELLAERGIRAAFFIITDRVPDAASRSDAGPQTFMSWPQLRELQNAGHYIGSHTASHRKLRPLGPTETHHELREADRRLQDELGVAAPAFAYPYGSVPVSPGRIDLLANRLCFGTVRSSAVDWREAPQEIRRTYLPADRPDRWDSLVEGWRTQCIASAS